MAAEARVYVPLVCMVKSGGAGQGVAEGWRQGEQENGDRVVRSRQRRAGKNREKTRCLIGGERLK